MKMITENYCDRCDACVHAVIDFDEFAKFRSGPVRCHCGHVVMPCNECDEGRLLGKSFDCARCPWRNCDPMDEMTDLDYVRFIKDDDPAVFDCYLNGHCGEIYQKLAEEIEKED